MCCAMNGVIQCKAGEVAELCRRFHVRRLSLFGSALTPEFDPMRSDLDFAVEFAALPPAEHASAYFGLLRSLEHLFSRRIDLVEIAALRNPYIRSNIERSNEVVYAA